MYFIIIIFTSLSLFFLFFFNLNNKFIALKKIMGLKQDEKYLDRKKLRYGGIVILTDADCDGSHIKGLIINLFQYFWPDLLKLDK